MVISTAMIQFRSDTWDELKNILDDEGIEIVEKYNEERVGVLIESETTKALIKTTERITKNPGTVAFDIAYYNSELEDEKGNS